MDLPSLINLERIEIVEETDTDFCVKYNNEFYTIEKSSESSFMSEGGASGPRCGMKQELRLEQRLVPETSVLQDDSVPIDFKEVMMFHELREQEYKDAHFADSHKRAVNDEILYVLKFFDEQKEAYFRFAEDYRRKHLKQDSQEKLGIQEVYDRWSAGCHWGDGMRTAYELSESLLGSRERSLEELSALVLEINKRREAASASSILYVPAIMSAVINRIPESLGNFSIKLPEKYVLLEYVLGKENKISSSTEIMKIFKKLLRRKAQLNFDPLSPIPATLSF